MAMFEIKYADPKTGKPQVVDVEFHNSKSGTANDWADECGRRLSGDGRFTRRVTKRKLKSDWRTPLKYDEAG